MPSRSLSSSALVAASAMAEVAGPAEGAAFVAETDGVVDPVDGAASIGTAGAEGTDGASAAFVPLKDNDESTTAASNNQVFRRGNGEVTGCETNSLGNIWP